MTAIIDGTNGVTTPNVLTSSSGVALTLQSGGTTAVTIDTSQNVGVGTVSPGAKLDVQGTSDTVIRAKGTSGTAGGIFRADGFGSGSYPGIQFAQSATTFWTVGQRGDTNLHIVRESGSGNVIIDSNALQTATTISVGGATPSSSGAGITFPATQSASSNANTLDDYEEGTWTPVATAASGSATFSTNGVYTKIGNVVILYASITITSAGSGGGLINFTGVPFNTKDSAQYGGLARECVGTGVNYCMNTFGTSGAVQSLTGGYPVWTTNLSYRAVIAMNVD